MKDRGRAAEGFYDTDTTKASMCRSSKQVYQKEITLPKRRCPRRGKPGRDNGVNEFANQTTLQGRSRGLA